MERLICRIAQRKTPWIQANTYLRLAVDHSCDARRVAIARIGQHKFAGFKAKPSKLLCDSLTLVRGEVEVIAFQGGQTEAIMNPPLAAGLARFAHRGCVQKTQRMAQQTRIESNPVLLP